MQDIQPLLHLNRDHSHQPHIHYSEARISFSLSPELTQSLRLITQTSGNSLAVIVLSAYTILLYRYTRQNEIIINTSISQEPTANNLENITLLQINLGETPTFNEMLKRVDSTYSMSHLHHVSPSDKMLETKKGEGEPNSLLQLLFVFANSIMNNIVLNYKIPQSELTLLIENRLECLHGNFIYNSNLYNSTTINRMLGHFQQLLSSIVADPQQRIGSLPLLTPQEEQQLLVEFNNTAVDYPQDKSIVHLFEEQVLRTPDNVAIVFEDEQLTYHELNARANQLAHYLRSKGVGAETLVPICIERSLEMIIGILGILKAGGAYVPIEADYPEERIKYMLEDTAARVVVSSKDSKEKLHSNDPLEVIELDTHWPVIAQQAPTNVPSVVLPNHLAYVIYTSGSTGKPKGVMIEHRSLVNYLANTHTHYINDTQGGAGSFIHLSYTFDASLTALFMPLLSGKFLVINSYASTEVFEDPNLLKYAPYDFIKLTPAHLPLLEATIHKSNNIKLTDKLVVGGEALRMSHFDYLTKEGIKMTLVNEYGPTEATVGCSTYWFDSIQDAPLLQSLGIIPIGTPISNTQIYILDEQQQAVPIGIAGELYIGGAGLARGYLNRPELTREKFLPHPFSTDATERLYRTGDRGRWLEDGTIEYLGRLDDQVKIRGYRIEPGEIEGVLLQSGLVKEAVVVVHDQGSGNKQLVGYYVAGEGVDKSSLVSWLHARLPAYMVPALWVQLPRMPLTPNGKVDKKALPAPVQALSDNYEAPASDTEKALAQIWQEVLHLEQVGLHDNFFELGGHSLLAKRLFTLIRKRFEINLPIATLLQAPTVQQLAILLGKQQHKFIPWSSLVPIKTIGSKPPLFCIHAGAGTVLFYHSLVRYLDSDQPVYGLQAKGLNGNEPPHTNIEQMAAHYINEIRIVQPRGPYYLAGYCMGGVLAFEMAQKLEAQGEQIALLANINSVAPGYVGYATKLQDEEDKESPANHTLNVEKSSIKEKLLYPLRLLKSKIWSYRVQASLRRWAYDYYIRNNRPLPEILGKHYFLESNNAIVNAYHPLPYSGQMIIIYSPGIYTNPQLGWTSLVTGGIHTYAITGEHATRRQIMEEPFVQLTAQKLKAYLPG